MMYNGVIDQEGCSLDIFRMKCLIRAAETLNYSQTAREMFISQSAVSQMVSNSEKELSIRIIDRDGKRMRLTEAGAVLIDGFKKTLQAYETAVRQAKDANARENELRIGYHGPMNWGTVPTLLATFKDQFPECRLSVRTDHWGMLMQDLSQGLLDVVFTESNELEQYPGLTSEFLFRDYPCVCMSILNPLAKKEKLHPSDLIGQNMIMTNSLQPSRSMNAIIKGLGDSGIDMEHTQFVTQLQLAFTMAAANLGITFLPWSFKMHEYNNLVFVNLEEASFHMDMMMAYAAKRLTNIGSEFVQLCRKWDFQGEV